MVDVREHRTAINWAHQIKHLLDDCYPEADKVLLVYDNLNTRKIAHSMKPLHPKKPAGSHDVWSYTTGPSTTVGSESLWKQSLYKRRP